MQYTRKGFGILESCGEDSRVFPIRGRLFINESLFLLVVLWPCTPCFQSYDL